MLRLTAILAITSLCVSAQEREKPPAGGQPKPFAVPAKQVTSLKNGLRITTVPYGTIPKVTVSARIRTGNVHEGPKEIWLADLLGELMKEGAGSRTAAEVADEAARMGGELSVSVGSDQTTVSISVLSEFAADAVNLVADVVQRPALPESELARLKTDRQRQLAVSLSSPQAIAEDLFRKTLYPDHPYGRIFPTQEMLESYTLEQVRGFYKANFGAKRTHLYIAGRFDPSISKTAAAAFEKWHAGAEQSYPAAKPVAAKSLKTANRPDAAQSTIRLGLPVIDPAHKDYIALKVTDGILGGTFMSRITSNIREQKGYSYSPFSFVATHYRSGHWVQNADVTTAATGASLKEIYSEIDKLRQTPPPADELKGVQAAMSGLFVLQNSSPNGIIGQLAFVDLQGLGDDWLKTYVQRVNAVKPADVQRISETYLNPAKMTLVVVGDEEKIKEQIQPFAGN